MLRILRFILNLQNTCRVDKNGIHQTEQRIAADCVAVIIYGQRRLGHKVPYTAAQGLFRFTTIAPAAGARQPVKVGYILHFGHQIAILSVDRQPVGLLNGEDMVIHGYFR